MLLLNKATVTAYCTQVVHLNKELLLMGELQQKYQQRLAAVSVSHNIKPELQFLLDACKQELASEYS